jgi:hypothetical protein
MTTTRDLARSYATKQAGFMGNTLARIAGRRGGAAATSTALQRMGDVTGNVRSFLGGDYNRRLRDSRIAKTVSNINAARPNLPALGTSQARAANIRAAGKGDLLKRLQTKMRTPAALPPPVAPRPVAHGMSLGSKLLLGGGLMAGGAMMAGGAAAAKERARQPLAAPEQIPPGY